MVIDHETMLVNTAYFIVIDRGVGGGFGLHRRKILTNKMIAAYSYNLVMAKIFRPAFSRLSINFVSIRSERTLKHCWASSASVNDQVNM